MFDDFMSSVISTDIANTYVEVLFFITSKGSKDYWNRIQTDGLL